MRITMDMKTNAADTELLKITHLDLELDGIVYFSDTSFSIKKHRGYFITGPDEEANILLLKILGGIFPPRSHFHNKQARVLFQGRDIYEDSERAIKEARKKIAFVFREGTMISNLNIRENLLLPFQYHYPDRDCSGILEKIGSDFDFFDISDVLDKRPDLLSYCVKKKLSFIRASLQEPELILVEKPMFNLDEQDQDQVFFYLENLKQKGVTFIIAGRSQSILETLIDEAIVLEKGKIPAMIAKTDERFADLFRFTKTRSQR